MAFVQAPLIGSPNVIRLFIQRGANVNVADECGFTALHHASGENLEVVKTLVEAGANINARAGQINARKERTRTPLSRAARCNKVDIIQYLLSRGTTLNILLEEWTPLHQAVRYNHVPATEALLNAGAPINAQDEDGQSPLYQACCLGDYNIEVTKLLLKKKPNIDLPNKWGKTPLLIACSNRSLKTVQLLIENGASLHLPDKDGETPLSCMRKSPEVFKEILSKMNAETNCNIL